MLLNWNLFAFSEQSLHDIDADKKSTRIVDIELENQFFGSQKNFRKPALSDWFFLRFQSFFLQVK